MDKADDMRLVKLSEGELKSRSRPFSGVAATPVGSTQRPTDFKSRPTLGIPAADVPDKIARRSLDRGPKAVTAQGPMTDQHRHSSPRHRPGQWLAVANIAHDLGIAAHFRECVEV